MRINREAKGSAYLQRSQLLPRKSLQNISYHCCSTGFTPLKYQRQRQDFVSKIVHTMGPVKLKCRICGILLQLVDSLLEYVCLKTQGQNPQMHSHAQDRRGSGAAACSRLCSQSNCRLRRSIVLTPTRTTHSHKSTWRISVFALSSFVVSLIRAARGGFSGCAPG